MSSQVITLVIYLLAVFAMSGLAYLRYPQLQRLEYSLASRKLGWVASAMSASSTHYSAWLFLGWVGMAYLMGVSILWMTLGSIPCVILGWGWLAQRLRVKSEEVGAISITGYLSRVPRQYNKSILVVSSLISLVCMIVYASAQMTGIGKLLEAVTPLSFGSGLVLGSGFIILNVAIGGYRGESYSDLLQCVLMVLSMVLLPVGAIAKIGGLGSLIRALQEQPHLLSPIGGFSGWSVVALVSLVPLVQVVTFSMPHTMKRMLSIKNPRMLKRVAVLYGILLVVLPLLGVVVGLSGRVLLPILNDPEQCFPLLADSLFPGVLSGLVTVGLVSAVMSSVDSQLIYAATEIGNNLFKGWLFRQASERLSVTVTRVSVVVVGILSLVLALQGRQAIFIVATYVASGLSSCFGPAVIMSLWRRTTGAGLLAGIIVGPTFVIWWHFCVRSTTFIGSVIHAPIGFTIAMLTIILVSLITKERKSA